MPAKRWVWTTNLLLDLIGYLVRAVAWSFFTWGLIATIVALLKLGSPVYFIPVGIAFCLFIGLICRWFSDGIYKRRRGRMLVVACCSLLFSTVSLISILVAAVSHGNIIQAMAVAAQSILYVFVAAVLFLGLARSKLLAAKES